MELLANGSTATSVCGHLGTRSLPNAILKYLLCSPNLDLSYRMLPTAGGLYNQRYRDMVEFSIIEARIRDVNRRRPT